MSELHSMIQMGRITSALSIVSVIGFLTTIILIGVVLRRTGVPEGFKKIIALGIGAVFFLTSSIVSFHLVDQNDREFSEYAGSIYSLPSEYFGSLTNGHSSYLTVRHSGDVVRIINSGQDSGRSGRITIVLHDGDLTVYKDSSKAVQPAVPLTELNWRR